MDYILLTPGPTPLPPSVYKVLQEPILHHRTKEFEAQFHEMIENMKYVFRTKNDVLMVSSSGTGAMESSIANLLSPGDPCLVHVTGAFGRRFVKLAKAYGLDPVVIEEEWGHAADPQKLEDALKKNSAVKAVFHQHTDTSTGVVNDNKTLAAIIHKHTGAVSVVDAISGLGAEELEVDDWQLDAVVTGSQKGLMGPPGLAFMTVSERGWKAAERAKLPRFYFDWRTMRDKVRGDQTPFTPAVMLVTAQREALRLIREEGIENVWKRTAELARYTREKMQGMGLELFAKDPADILTAVKMPEGVDGQKLIREILTQEKISIAGGQLHLKGKIIRLAHMGYIRKPDVDAGLKALSKRLSKVAA